MIFDFWSAYWAFVAFVFGAIVGSFLNVCIWRLPRGQSVSGAPSHCPKCEHRLHMWPDMVPLCSQLWYRSRCRYCGTKFSWRYFWVELFTAVVFMAVYLRFVPFGNPMFTETQQTVISGFSMLFVAALITLFFIDLDTYTIPDTTVVLAVVAGLGKDFYLIGTGARSLYQHLPGIPFAVPIPVSVLGGLIAFWLLWQFAALSSAALGREAMGAGDSLLLGAMGAFLVPWPLVVVAFLLSVALGSVGGLAGKLLWKEPAPETAEADKSIDDADAPLAPVTATTDEEALHLNGHAQLEEEALIESEARVEEAAATYAHAAAHGIEAGAGGPAPAESGEGIALSDEGASEAQTVGDGAEPSIEPAEPPFPVDEDGAPLMPAGSRWGRLWTVAGSWLAVGSLYVALMQFQADATAAVAIGITGLGAAAAVLFFGIRMWVAADKPFLEQMDAYFDDGEPGPRFIPFGPYLVIGSFAAMLFGRDLVELYCRSNGIDLAVIQTLPWEVPGRAP